VSLKPLPKGKVESLIITKPSAARSQLESAIWLWFNEGDPVSIHALAVAAHDCFNALVKHRTQKSSGLQQYLETQSKGRQKRIRLAQNFFKHGAIHLKEKISLHTIDAETFLMDSVSCAELLGKPSALTRLYAERFLYEHPALITEEALPKFAKNAEVHQLVNTTRHEFFLRLWPFFLERYPLA
jgi:hypothetical protein